MATKWIVTHWAVRWMESQHPYEQRFATAHHADQFARALRLNGLDPAIFTVETMHHG